jgi:hypothetical protein
MEQLCQGVQQSVETGYTSFAFLEVAKLCPACAPGASLWAVGLGVEAVADWQKDR